MTDDHDERDRPAEVSACVFALERLAAGDLANWAGLAGCKRRDVEAAFGEGSPVATFGRAQRYAAAPGAPLGIEVRFFEDRFLELLIARPVLASSIKAALGQPEHIERFGIEPDTHQWVYPSRGLVFHVDRLNGQIWALGAFPPTTLDLFQQTMLYRLRYREEPIE